MGKLVAMKGGVCALCPSTSGLQFDHIDRSTKSFTIGSKIRNYSWARILEEAAKCQLLCEDCHTKKTVREQGFQLVRGQDVHGTLTSYRYCKCDLCREVKSKYMEEYNKAHPRNRRKSV